MLLSNLRRNLSLVIVLCALMFNQAVPAMAHSLESKAPVAPSIQIGITRDKCSGQLYVLNSSLQWQAIRRGHRTSVAVHVNPDGYWHWRCGSTYEISRSAVLAKQVHRLEVVHSTENRDITWYTYSE
jgi:hypothetical protein